MKTSDLSKGLFVALLLGSPLVGAESKYPAANFEPGVVYKDDKLIEQHTEAAKERSKETSAPQARVETKSVEAASKSASVEAVSSSEPSVSNSAQGKESAVGNLPIALVVLAIGGFAFWSSRKGTAKPAAPATTPAAAGETGVAKYLKTLPEAQGSAETGVAKYLKDVVGSASPAAQETGVAKYVKNLPDVAVGSETGVAKYLKNVK